MLSCTSPILKQTFPLSFGRSAPFFPVEPFLYFSILLSSCTRPLPDAPDCLFSRPCLYGARTKRTLVKLCCSNLHGHSPRAWSPASAFRYITQQVSTPPMAVMLQISWCLTSGVHVLYTTVQSTDTLHLWPPCSRSHEVWFRRLSTLNLDAPRLTRSAADSKVFYFGA